MAPKPAEAPSSGRVMAPQSAQNAGMRADYYYPQPYQNATPPITDTREFLKMNYSAQMRTRDVQSLTKRVETTVRGYDGRVDQTSSSPKYGYVTFVVPASKFDAFRDEIEALVNPRFLTVTIHSENLLPQKQGIEVQQKQVETSLADLQANRKKLVADHKSAIASLQAQIDDATIELAALRNNVTSDPVRQSQIAARVEQLITLQTTLNSRVANENSSYKYNLNSIDSQIKYSESNLDSVKKQDQNLLDNVATVNGTISLNWISSWEIAHLYLPGNTIPAIFCVFAALAYLWHRYRERTFSHSS